MANGSGESYRRLPSVANSLVDEALEHVEARIVQRVRACAVGLRLTVRETLVLVLAVAGLNDKGIADALGCTEGTLKAHWAHVRSKAGVHSQRDVLALIIRRLP